MGSLEIPLGLGGSTLEI